MKSYRGSDDEDRRGKRKPSELLFGLGPTMTEEQKTFLASIYENQLTIVDARAGTGKTTIAVAAAKTLGKPLIYVVAPVQNDVQGFIPGPPSVKDAPYLRGLRDALLEIREDPMRAIIDPENPVAQKMGEAWIEACSYTYWRGGNLENATLIIDEAQNFTVPRLKTMLTRVHDNTKVIVIGHMGQCDLRNRDGEIDPSLSGFPRLIEHFRDKPYANICELTHNFRGQLANDADEM